MRKSFVSFVLLVLILIYTTFTVSADGVRYVFDEVVVHYAAEFVVTPVSVEEDNWLAVLAGGIDQPVTVLLGDVSLNNNREGGFSEQFIMVTGSNGSERFLINSGSYDGPIKSFYWSAKQLIGNEVVKDFSGPIKSLTLIRFPRGEADYERIILSSANDGQKAADEFWNTTVPQENIYEADLETLQHVGSLSR